MSSRGAWMAVMLVVAACHGRSPPPRDRTLSRISADSIAVLAADGRALAHPKIRGVVEVLRPRWPSGLGCAIDVALASDHVAVGVSWTGTTIVIETRAVVQCPALSQIEPGLWVATIGDGALAKDHAVTRDDRFARARPYLTTAPIAASVLLPIGRVLATMQPDPLQAWVAIDSSDAMADTTAKKLISYVAQLAADPKTEPFAKHIKITREGPQVIARLQGPVTADLAVVARALLAGLPRTVVRAERLRCPATLTAPVRECRANGPTGLMFIVSPLGAAVSPILAAELTPVVTNSAISGLRVPVAIPSLGIEPGDVIVASAGRTITHRVQLSEILRRARVMTTISVSRDGSITELSLVER